MTDTIRLVCQGCGNKVEAQRDADIDPPEAVRCETTSCCVCNGGDFLESFYFDAAGKEVGADPMRWTAQKEPMPASLTSVDDACRGLVALCRELGAMGVNLSICCDGRVYVELFRDSIGSVHEHADIAHPEDPLPAPGRAVTLVAEKFVVLDKTHAR